MSDEERRKDPETRSRLSKLEKQLLQRVTDMEKRLRWLSRKLLIGQLWLAVAIIGMGGGFYYLYTELQDSRRDASYAACTARNGDRQGIQDFVIAQSGPMSTDTPEYRALPQSVKNYINQQQTGGTAGSVEEAVKRAFPIVQDCNAAAKAAVE